MKNIRSGNSKALQRKHYHIKKTELYSGLKYSFVLSLFSMFILFNSFTFDNNEKEKDDNNNTAMAQNGDQEYFYYYNDEKIYLEINTNSVFVSGNNQNSIENAEISSYLDISNATTVKEDKTRQKLNKPINAPINNASRYWSEIELNTTASSEEYFEKIENVRRSTDLLVAPFFRAASGKKVGLTNYFYVKLKDESDFDLLVELAERHSIEIVGYNKFMPLWFTMSVTSQSDDALQMANFFFETGYFEHAQPDLMVDMSMNSRNRKLNNVNVKSNTALETFDDFFEDQWGLRNTGQHGGTYGIDINAEDAWGLTTGDYNTIVAVIDEGIELDHPDLANNIAGSFDAVSGTFPSQVYGAHGTSCGGIVGAIDNNGIGISGVAPDAGLFSVSISFGSTTLYQDLADAINWSWINGAAVLSNSWGGGPPFSIVDDAINSALANGRGGLGSVVVFATGNDNVQDVSWPADSNPDILAVGAMSPCAERKNTSSCDGETNWGSNYGSEIDIVAPGVLIPTTDRQGDLSGSCVEYNPDPCYPGPNYSDLDYTNDFNGTSSATPHVAGVAGLMLSINPDLTAIEVNEIIELTAQKVGGYNYSNTGGHPNGPWNIEMGYGLVNAYGAVNSAQNSCVEYWNLPVVELGGIYQAEHTVSSTANINPNLTAVVFRAGDNVNLNTGFKADAYNGYYFVSEIQECSNNFNPGEDDTAIVMDEVEYILTREYKMEPTSREDLNQGTEQLSELGYSLKNSPNPFSDKTNFDLQLNNSEQVSLIVSDMNGRLISTLQKPGLLAAGKHQFTFDGNSLRPGVYYYTMQIGNDIKTGKLFLIK